MKISEQQLMQLIVVLKDSIKMDIMGLFSYKIEDRVKLLNNIVNQQDNLMFEVGKEEGVMDEE